MSEYRKVNEKEYLIIKLLGKGKGGYSYLASDGTRQYVLKQIHHEPCDYYQFGNKIEAEKKDYERLRSTGIRMPKMLALDENKERILKEYIEGPTIYDLILNDKMKDDKICWKIINIDSHRIQFPAHLLNLCNIVVFHFMLQNAKGRR